MLLLRYYDGHLIVPGYAIEVRLRIQAHDSPRRPRNIMQSDADLDSASEPNSDSMASRDKDEEQCNYDDWVLNWKTQSIHYFIPDSASEFNVLTREH